MLGNKSFNFQNITVTKSSTTATEIVTLTDVKNYLKLDTDLTADDALITQLISAARIFTEKYCNTILTEQTFVQKQNGGIEDIELTRTPVINVSSVIYNEVFESTGSTISTSDYRVADNKLININDYWDAGRLGDGYVITYTAGLYANTTATVTYDEQLIAAQLRLIAHLYENRQNYVSEVSEGNWTIKYTNIDHTIAKLLMPFSNPTTFI